MLHSKNVVRAERLYTPYIEGMGGKDGSPGEQRVPQSLDDAFRVGPEREAILIYPQKGLSAPGRPLVDPRKIVHFERDEFMQ